MSRIKADVIVLGGGPGGYPAAIRSAENGKKTVLVERDFLGGTCLNYGCIPTKTLLASSRLYKKIREAKDFGIMVDTVHIDWERVIARKNTILGKLRSGIAAVLSSHGITVVNGTGRLTSPHTVVVSGKEEVTLEAEHIIISTGSSVKQLPILPVDGRIVHDSTTILESTKIPESIVILGAGAIGCEFASLFSAVGSKVYLVEALPRILPSECPDSTAYLAKLLEKQNVEIVCGQKVIHFIPKSSSGIVELENGRKIEASNILVAVGRALNSKNIGLEELHVHMNNGAITVNDQMRTNIPSIFAVGDITAKSMCAHVATHQGVIAADVIAQKDVHMSYEAIPSVVYTFPEYASVGLHLQEAKDKGYDVTSAEFPFKALGKAIVSGNDSGFSRVVVDKKTGQILGAQVIADGAGDLIAEMTMSLANELTVECVTHTIHAHPTDSECWLETVFLAEGMPLNFIKK